MEDWLPGEKRQGEEEKVKMQDWKSESKAHGLPREKGIW